MSPFLLFPEMQSTKSLNCAILILPTDEKACLFSSSISCVDNDGAAAELALKEALVSSIADKSLDLNLLLNDSRVLIEDKSNIPSPLPLLPSITSSIIPSRFDLASAKRAWPKPPPTLSDDGGDSGGGATGIPVAPAPGFDAGDVPAGDSVDDGLAVAISGRDVAEGSVGNDGLAVAPDLGAGDVAGGSVGGGGGAVETVPFSPASASAFESTSFSSPPAGGAVAETSVLIGMLLEIIGAPVSGGIPSPGTINEGAGSVGRCCCCCCCCTPFDAPNAPDGGTCTVDIIFSSLKFFCFFESLAILKFCNRL
jgi:hypothetical protein